MTMLLYDLGPASWAETQLLYHALAYLGRPALVLTSPDRPYVSTGYSQDPSQELDLAYCQSQGLPVFRREVGGGLVYLDDRQVFWQVVLDRRHPLVTVSRAAFYRRLLEPAIQVYRRLGVQAELAGLNDLAVGGRKICGTGAGEIGDCVALVGNVLGSFDCAAMARVLKAPDEIFRARCQWAMEENITSLARELGPAAAARIDQAQVREMLAQEYGRLLGPLQPAQPDPELERAVERLGRRMLDPAWTAFKRKARPCRQVKIKAGLFLCAREINTPAGPLRALYHLEEGHYGQISLHGPGLPPNSPLPVLVASALEGRPREDLPSALRGLSDGPQMAGAALNLSDLIALFTC